MMKEAGGSIVMTIAATIVLIILSIIYFTITLFVVKAAANIIFDGGLSGDFGVLAASIITLGSMLGGTMGSRKLM